MMFDFLYELGEDGAAVLTQTGHVVIYVLVALSFVLIAALASKKKMTAKELAFSAVAISIAFLLSNVRLFRMPWGGSVTLFSMFFVTLVGYFFGAYVGFAAAFAYGLLQFVQGGGSYMLSIWQVGFDYLFAFTALGASGLFKEKKNGLVIGYLAAVLLRGLFHSIGGYLYWMDYMPDNFPRSLAFAYPVLYNYAYIGAEAVISLILINLPPVKKALAAIRNNFAAPSNRGIIPPSTP